MVVIDPLKVTIENFSFDKPLEVNVPNFPTKPEMGSHKVNFSNVIYIENSDFMEIGDKGYRRLTKNQAVGLRHAGYVLEVTKVLKDIKGKVAEVVCKCKEVDKVETKPKAFIHWVSNPLPVEIRIYDTLFRHRNPEDPNEVPGGYLSDCNLDSLHIKRGFADQSIKRSKVFDKFQFERIGFFSVDPDTTSNKVSI